MKKSAYLYFPLLLIALYFGADKLFSLNEYKRLTMDDAPFLIFEYKEQLLDELAEVYQKIQIQNLKLKASDDEHNVMRPRQKTALVMGTSRMLFLNHKHFSRNYPDWELFNFSGPVTYPAYYLYVLERALDRNVKPDLLIVEAAPFQYSDGTDAFTRSNLAYSFDLSFIIDHFQNLKRDEVSYFLARFLFSGYRYPPKIKNIRARIGAPDENKTYQIFLTMEEWQKQNQDSQRNLIPKEDWFQQDYATLQYQAKYKTIPWLYTNYQISERQFDFLNQLLKLAKENDIQVLLVNPAVSGPLQREIKNRKELQAPMLEFDRRMQQLQHLYQIKRIDYNKHANYKCNTFVDAAHMATGCYNLMMADLMYQWYTGMDKKGAIIK